MADYKRGEGTNALPQGGATQANASVPAPAPGPSMQPLAPQDIPVEYASPTPVDGGRDMKESENSQLLTAPSDPNFVPPLEPAGRVPKGVARRLPLVASAVKDPEAPRSLRALYAAMVMKLEEENGVFD